MAQLGYLQSPACDVFFQGFSSTLHRLQNCGWVVAVSEDPYRNRLHIMLNHKAAQVTMEGSCERPDAFRDRYESGRQQPMEVHIHKCSPKFISMAECSLDSYSIVDARPRFISMGDTDSDRLFASAVPKVEEILIEPQSVAECLELIRKMQVPEMVEVRKRNEARNAAQRFHAQIVSTA